MTDDPSAGLSVSLLAVALLGALCLTNKPRRLGFGLCFLWAGALGNLIDRLLYGYVIDWLYVGLYVNFADMWLCLGGVMMLARLSGIRRV